MVYFILRKKRIAYHIDTVAYVNENHREISYRMADANQSASNDKENVKIIEVFKIVHINDLCIQRPTDLKIFNADYIETQNYTNHLGTNYLGNLYFRYNLWHVRDQKQKYFEIKAEKNNDAEIFEFDGYAHGTVGGLKVRGHHLNTGYLRIGTEMCPQTKVEVWVDAKRICEFEEDYWCNKIPFYPDIEIRVYSNIQEYTNSNLGEYLMRKYDEDDWEGKELSHKLGKFYLRNTHFSDDQKWFEFLNEEFFYIFQDSRVLSILVQYVSDLIAIKKIKFVRPD